MRGGGRETWKWLNGVHNEIGSVISRKNPQGKIPLRVRVGCELLWPD
jgi:hypothetical protein